MRRAVLVVAAAAAPAHAGGGFTEAEQSLRDRAAVDSDSPWPALELAGGMRLRGGYLYNLDLDRGLTPDGTPVFPVPDAGAQAIAARDFRLRTDLVARTRGGTAALHLRLDLLDTGLGGTRFDDASERAGEGGAALRLRRAYAEILTPLGVVIAGRMANQFGLGMVANSGDCLDCDGGDATDRVGLVVPVRGFIAAVAIDLSIARPDRPSELGLDPRDNAHGVTLALLRYRGDTVREIRRRGGRATVDYGGALGYVWQDRDTPADYLLDEPPPMAASMERGFRGIVASGWLRADLPRLRVEAEGAAVAATIAQASPIPGALFRDPVQLRQLGLAVETEAGAPEAAFGAGVDAGYASGDPAPGFGAFPSLANVNAGQGALDGPQARPPHDNRIDNFRFSPNYRIDRILFRQLIGTVTDAVYLRPHARYRIGGGLTAGAALIASWAVEPSSTPSGARALGVELDTTVAYRAPRGFVGQLAHAVLLPGAGLDGPMLPARTAQSIELLVGYLF